MISDEQLRQAAKEYEQALLASLPETAEPHEFPAGFWESVRPRKKPIPWKPILRAACIPLVIGLAVWGVVRLGMGDKAMNVPPMESADSYMWIPSNSQDLDASETAVSTQPPMVETPAVEPAAPTPEPSEPTEPESVGDGAWQELAWVPEGYAWSGYKDGSDHAGQRGCSTYRNGSDFKITFCNSTEGYYYTPEDPIFTDPPEQSQSSHTVTYSTVNGVRVKLCLANGKDHDSNICWQLDGVYFVISGRCTEEELIRMAASVI